MGRKQDWLLFVNENQLTSLAAAATRAMQTVAGECQSALDWLSEKEGLQQQTAKVGCGQGREGA